MARCEDFPCCGHEAGCCPDFDEAGNQLNMVCVCGAKLPVNAAYSICPTCMGPTWDDREEDGWRDDEPDVDYLTENEDFEQADEYFQHEDYGDFDGPFGGE